MLRHKKLTALCLAAGLLLSALTGCAGGQGASPAATPFPLPTEPETGEIFVEPVPDLDESFLRGMDASSVLAEEASGVIYRDRDGQPQDVFLTLAQAGVSCVRLRVWNDPYDEQGRGYGGGNNDLAAAVTLGGRASAYGMSVCVDFHYSDFWADPKRQHAPKAWADMSAEEKAAALGDYTAESLNTLLDAGVNVSLVQIGNEINYGMAGETGAAALSLLDAGSAAVRRVSAARGQNMRVAVHYTNVNDPDELRGLADTLSAHGLDYDVLALSYYPFWHEDLENLGEVIRDLKRRSGKDVLIAETAYCWTDQDGDGFANSVSGAPEDLVEGYPATVQGQAHMLRDVFAAAAEAGACGVFYWEGTWVPVGSDPAANAALWAEHGSGWASPYAADYDPEDAGLYYGGCAWDNQALFDHDGRPLASLDVFRCLRYGCTAPLAVEAVLEPGLTLEAGESLRLPETVQVVYNDPAASGPVPVRWDESVLAGLDTDSPGSYAVPGTLEDGTAVRCAVTVVRVNLAQNPGFEDPDTGMWTVRWSGGENPTDFQRKSDDAHSGEMAFHFWSPGEMDFSIEQSLEDLAPGTYRLSAWAQGGDIPPGAEFTLYAVTAQGEESTAFTLQGWANWQQPQLSALRVTDGVLTFGVRVRCGAKGWGTVDDFTLNRVGD